MATDETSPLLPTTDQNNTEPQQDTMSTLIWKTGAVFGATAVGLGAFGAHGLKKHISEPHKIANWSTAAQYQVRTHLTFSPFIPASPFPLIACVRKNLIPPRLAHPLRRPAHRQQ